MVAVTQVEPGLGQEAVEGAGPVLHPPEPGLDHLKTWKILFTDYRWPLNTFLDSFRAAIGLYFFELIFLIILNHEDYFFDGFRKRVGLAAKALCVRRKA